jgi:hypothetical protein
MGREESMVPKCSGRKVMIRQANVMGLVLVLGAVGFAGCVPDWAKQGDAPVVLLLTGINNGSHIDSDLRISNGSICPDFATVRVENHFKNPSVTGTGFRGDLVIDHYEVRYVRSDGRSVEGVDVPFHISGSVAQEVQADSEATLSVEIVRRQAKIEPPLSSLAFGNGPTIVTMFAEVTLFAHTTINQSTNSATGRVQVDFADFGDTQTACATQ